MKKKQFVDAQSSKCVFKLKFPLIMRTILVLLFVAVMHLHAGNGYAQQTTEPISMSHVSIEQVLNRIEETSDFVFLYNNKTVNTSRIVSVHNPQNNIPQILDGIFKGTPITYAILDKQIILSTTKSKTADQDPSFNLKGMIKDTSGEPLIGVNVVVKGTSIGTISDVDGNFMIKAKSGDVIEFSYVGYASQAISVSDNKLLTVVMKEDTEMLGEVVVTAMGIERKAESLTYATQTVGGNELTRAKEANLINSLQGKSAGLIITPNSGGAGSASKILLRGNASMLGNNSPLIVVDGVPMHNSVAGQLGLNGGANLMADGSGEGGDALSQLNPDDIASITVLKGANSAALYGSAASNGVLMITTKKGQQGTMRVDVSSSTTFETPLVLPELQNIYGSSISGSKENGFVIGQSSWGGKLSDMTPDQLNPAYSSQRLTNQAYNIRDFYQVGTNFNNSVALSGGTEKVQTYFSYGNTTAAGIMPNNKFYRHNIALRENFSFFNDKLKINISANYINQKSKNRPGGGMSSSLGNLYTAARNADMNYYRNNYSDLNGSWKTSPYSVFVKTKYPDPNNPKETIEVNELGSIQTLLTGEKQRWYLQDVFGKNNPWWQSNKNDSEVITNHVFGSAGFDYNILEGLNLQARIKYDYSEETNESRQFATTMRPSDMNERGRLIWQHDYSRQFYGDFMLSYAKQIQDFSFAVNAGGSMMNSKSNYWKLTPSASSGAPYQEDLSFNQFILSDIYIKGGNGSDITGGGLPTENWERAIFATVQLSFKEIVNLEGSYRDDWYRAFTQFPNMAKHYPYFSVGANVLINNLWQLPEQFNELKVRTSYSEVGNSIPNELFLQSAKRNPATGGYIMSGQTDFKDPKPETTASFEAGFDLSMFNHAFNMDITYYHALMRNQFMSYSGKGGKTVFTNSGKVRNQGIEITASYTLSPNADFSWRTGANFSYNSNKILSTAKKQDGKDLLREVDLGNGSGLKIKFLPGGSYGDLYATDYLKDKDGKIRINKTTGRPFIDQANSTVKLGNMNAKYNLGWHNTFIYKDLQLYVLIDGKIGGKIVSFTESFLDFYGVSQRTAESRLNAERNNIVWVNKKGVSYPGMYLADGTLTSIEAYYSATGGPTPLGQNYVYDGTNFRLREISLGYTFRNVFGASKNLTVSANARNLFFLYKDAPIDPETSLTTQNALGNVDVFSMPTTRSFGISLKATF